MHPISAKNKAKAAAVTLALSCVLATAVPVSCLACRSSPESLRAEGQTFLVPASGALPSIKAAPSGQPGNEYPVVLVGGVGCWGRDELLGLFYFGGLTDIQRAMTGAGIETVTSAVGPLSSYWDRACELYAQIKGRRVDYGAAHSRSFGHARWGRDYEGKALVPGWGDSVAKIHLMTHSMGGPTARCLVALLENGSPENISEDAPESLFSGGRHWVSGVLTISATHDGTTLTAMKYPLVGGMSETPLQRLAACMIVLFQGRNSFYDFKLDHFGLTRRAGESSAGYYARVRDSPIWSKTEDIATYDASPEGAREFNGWALTCPDVYYFSWATESVSSDPFSNRTIPDLSMNPFFALTGMSSHLGSYTQSGPGLVPVDERWWRNDGVVNTNSMDGPSVGCPKLILPWSGKPERGRWNHLGCLSGVDHIDAIGFGTHSIVRFFVANGMLLRGLPQ